MHYFYKYVPHSMEKIQDFLDYIFYEVWCKASRGGSYSLKLFSGKPELHDVLKDLHYSDAAGSFKFRNGIESIYKEFRRLSSATKEEFEVWYRSNNDIESSCSNKLESKIIRYKDLKIRFSHTDLVKELEAFYKNLYSAEFLSLKAVRQVVGDINDHYNTFMQVNDEGVCPFCGIEKMESAYDKYREAYDHYLPKAIYPFNSLNFRNLAPACHKCNSTYKGSKDPVYKSKDPILQVDRKRFFYPYSIKRINLSFKLNFSKHPNDIEPNNVELTVNSDRGNKEELEVWKRVYGIESRYKAISCAKKNMGKAWLVSAFDEWTNEGELPSEYIRKLRSRTAREPLTDLQFLKLAFLEECENHGVFNQPQARS